MTYSQARKDFERLESVYELGDQQALDERRLDLMENPTKEHAKLLYLSAIRMWFFQNRIRVAQDGNYEIIEIAKRHGINISTGL